MNSVTKLTVKYILAMLAILVLNSTDVIIPSVFRNFEYKIPVNNFSALLEVGESCSLF
jgi:hypothetical protein